MRGSSHKRVPVALKLPQLQVHSLGYNNSKSRFTVLMLQNSVVLDTSVVASAMLSGSFGIARLDFRPNFTLYQFDELLV